MEERKFTTADKLAILKKLPLKKLKRRMLGMVFIRRLRKLITDNELTIWALKEARILRILKKAHD